VPPSCAPIKPFTPKERYVQTIYQHAPLKGKLKIAILEKTFGLYLSKLVGREDK
jgi:hypothetical protein